MNAEFEAFLNNEVGKMYANDTQKLMLYRVDADERESYGYKDMGQIERLGALLSMLGEKWAYSAQVESLQQSDGRELLAEIVRMVGRIPTEEAVTVRGSTEQHTMLDVTLARLSEAMQVDGAREIKATPLMYGSTMLWQTRDRQIIGLPEDAQAAVTMTREATTDALGTVMRFDTPEETFAAQTLENAAAMWQALALTSWVAWDDD